ncbi:3-oxoacyl-ACP reductase [Thermaurantimonas aggregans]|uniref:3-oxoacyl-ACP reductase n=1 Tax=Thermaurantimonas aggregans TaxID=2173829 RepID=A0A401XK32_9FLAO|nr:SDR family oxidoreductase [Thermaurantimonas aggregans]GCD77350.1 3-oxoacyl-ACP reductase [Thermaurantimonas aggregans]
MNILLTGVSRGLGLEIAKIILEKGWRVYGISRSKTEQIDELKRKYSETFLWMQYDLENSKDVREKIFKHFITFKNPIHGFVNNAATAYDDLITNLDLDHLEKMFHVNVFTPMLITKYVIRQMLLHNVKGSIVHISSISAHTGYKGLAMYASTKAALEAFSKTTAREWGERGIRSNALVAGFMDTDMSSTLSEEQKERIYKRTSLREATDVRSVASTIAFLLSEEAKSITGQNIFVDNGTI